jgi:serine/threonine protein kinase
MSPELYTYPDEIEGEELFKVDIFAFGVSMFIVAFGFPPFESTNPLDNCAYWRLFSKDK